VGNVEGISSKKLAYNVHAHAHCVCAAGSFFQYLSSSAAFDMLFLPCLIVVLLLWCNTLTAGIVRFVDKWTTLFPLRVHFQICLNFWFQGAVLRWVLTCNVTAYHNTVLWQCGWDSCPRNISKVGYAVMLWSCSVCFRYLAITSKGWYDYGLSRSGRTMWLITTVCSSRLLYIHDASVSRNKLGTPWCNTHRILLHHEAWYETSDRNSMLCQSLATLQRYGMR
jgi:hypothetical protein